MQNKIIIKKRREWGRIRKRGRCDTKFIGARKKGMANDSMTISWDWTWKQNVQLEQENNKQLIVVDET